MARGGCEGRMPRGFALLVLMMGRGAYWAIAAIPAGIAQGIALGEKKVMLNGLLGALLGGVLRGILFDPVYLLCTTPGENASLNRAVGFGVIGLSIGPFISCV